MTKKPKLRTVQRYRPPFPLNKFPPGFHIGLGREIIYLLATRITPRLEGADWEEIFARLIGGKWKPSNVGLDDVLLEQTAWSAKTVKKSNPSKTKKIRLISGRNSPSYSFDIENVKEEDPDELGAHILSIWNERVSAVRAKYNHLRTVVLIKSNDLLEVAAFEFDTIMYMEENFHWRWNIRGNLEGFEKSNDEHRFTWQPHGSQFTIIEDVPKARLAIRIKSPPPLDRSKVLNTIQVDDSWIKIIK